MFCKNCGNEISDDAVFCSNCGCSCKEDATGKGKINDIKNVATSGKAGNIIMDMLGETKEIIKLFFSRNPVSAIEKLVKEKTYTGLFMIIICTLIISFAFCVNSTQVINYIISVAKNGAVSLVGSMGDVGASLSSVGDVVEIKLPVMYGLFWKMFLAYAAVSVVEVVLIYVIMMVKKQKPESILYILNVVGIANIPIMMGEVVCLVVGFIFVPLVFIIVASTLIIKVILIYEGMKELLDSEDSPVWEISVFAAIMCIAMIIIGSMLLTGTVGTVYEVLKSKVDSMTNDMSSFY